MAHALSIRENGFVEFAYVGEKAWHGLGQEVPADASIDDWKIAAGMDWEVKPSAMQAMCGDELVTVEGKKLLYRSDNKKQLSVVGEDYKVVQPAEVLNFFDDLCKLNGMKMSTAGVLFEGRRFWALADTGEAFDPVKGDEVQNKVLLVTSVDGTMSTQARFVSTRVVCANTMSIALAENSKQLIKVTHKSDFDPTQVKIDMGLLSESWVRYQEQIKRLTQIKYSENDARKFYEKVFFDASKEAEKQSLKMRRIVDDLTNKAFHGIGAEFNEGTAWGVLNGATELFTHWKEGKKNGSSQFWSSTFGEHNKFKDMVFEGLQREADLMGV